MPSMRSSQTNSSVNVDLPSFVPSAFVSSGVVTP